MGWVLSRGDRYSVLCSGEEKIFLCCGRITALRIFNTKTVAWEPPPSTARLPAGVGSARAFAIAAAGDSLFILGGFSRTGDDPKDAAEGGGEDSHSYSIHYHPCEI
eukprot:6132152-Amphidinium_carterae.1